MATNRNYTTVAVVAVYVVDTPVAMAFAYSPVTPVFRGCTRFSYCCHTLNAVYTRRHRSATQRTRALCCQHTILCDWLLAEEAHHCSPADDLPRTQFD